jgi:[histone H3]-lysine36 N-dimethyltransferase SETMAR
VQFHHDNAPYHKSRKMIAKMHELGYKLLLHPSYSPDLAPSDFFLFADLKRMFAGKKFNTNEEVIAKTEASFGAMSKSYYQSGIGKLYDRYNRCIALESIYNVFSYVSLRTFQPTLLIKTTKIKFNTDNTIGYQG